MVIPSKKLVRNLTTIIQDVNPTSFFIIETKKNERIYRTCKLYAQSAKAVQIVWDKIRRRALSLS